MQWIHPNVSFHLVIVFLELYVAYGAMQWERGGAVGVKHQLSRAPQVEVLRSSTEATQAVHHSLVHELVRM